MQFVDNSLQHFEFLGRVLGKAVYEGILVEPLFASFFLNKLVEKFNYVDDLRSLDPEVQYCEQMERGVLNVFQTYQNLISLKQYSGKVEDLGLFFTITRNAYGESKYDVVFAYSDTYREKT